MNRRQIINKILHDHIDVNRHEDYTNYKKLITAIEEWYESEVEKLPLHDVVSSSVKKELLIAELDDKRCIGVEMNEDMWYYSRKETAQHLLNNYNITPK